MALPTEQPRESGPRHNRFQRAKPNRPSSAVALTTIVGTLVFAAGCGLIYYVSTWRSPNADVRALTERADAQSGLDQAKRLLDRAGPPRTPDVTPAAPAKVEPIQPPSPSLVTIAWNWITRHTTSSSAPATPPTAERPPTETAAWLQRLREQQQSTKTATPPQPAPSLPQPVASAPPPAPLPPPVALVAPPKQDKPETTIASVATPLPPPPAKPELVLRPFDTAGLARFLHSEHDLSKIPDVPLAIPHDPIAGPVAAPVAMPAPPPLPPPNAKLQAIAVPQLPPEPKRRHSNNADCTAIIEQAQLGDLSDDARKFLQEKCR